MSIFTVTVIVIVTTCKSFLIERRGRHRCGGHRKESFKGSKTGVGFLHIGLLSRHGGTLAVLFHETMNYILCEQIPASPLQVGKSWPLGQSIARIIISYFNSFFSVLDFSKKNVFLLGKI